MLYTNVNVIFQPSSEFHLFVFGMKINYEAPKTWVAEFGEFGST